MSAKKKVVFCTYSCIYSSIALEQLIADTDIELVAIINSTRLFRPSLNSIKGALTQLKISGLRYSTYLFLITDFFKWSQSLLALRNQPLRNIHTLAKRKGIPIINTRDINEPEEIKFIEKYNPDFLLCVHFNQLLKAPVFALDKMECINIHPSLLPSYKGVDPVFFAMKDNVDEFGVTLHRMDENFDSGAILLQTAFNLDASKSLLFNNCQLFAEGTKLAMKWIKNSKNLTQAKLKNDTNTQNYDSWPTVNDVKDFKQSGKRLMRLSGLWSQQ